MEKTLYRPRTVLAVAVFTFAASLSALANEIHTTGNVAINGYDAVAYFTDHKAVRGLAKFTTSYRGAIFHFASAAHRDAFMKNPRDYTPQYGGYCAYGTARGYKAPTEPQAFTIVEDKLYLNYNDSVMTTWRADVTGYIGKADANWDTVKAQPAP